MDLQTLEGHVRGYILDVVQSTDDLVPTFINRAIRIAEERPFNFAYMAAEQAFTTTEGARLLGAKPTRWKRSRGLPYLTSDDFGTTHEIQWAPSESEMLRMYPSESAPATDRAGPRFVLERSDELWVYPVPDGESDYSDGDYRITVPYWTFSADLVDPDDDNWLTINAGWYVVFRATAEGLIRNREEERAATYLQLAEAEYTRVMNHEKRSRLPDRMSLHVRRDVFAPTKGPRKL